MYVMLMGDGTTNNKICPHKNVKQLTVPYRCGHVLSLSSLMYKHGVGGRWESSSGGEKTPGAEKIEKATTKDLTDNSPPRL